MPIVPVRTPGTTGAPPASTLPPQPGSPEAPWGNNPPPVPPAPGPAPTSSSPGMVTHDRGNHDDRRYGLTQSQGSISIPDQLIEQQQAAESDNQEYPVVQEAVPPRPLGL